jgi:muramoyltetrapeptide carboxypeptidase
MIKIPPYLRKGDVVGMVAPSGFMSIEKIEKCIATISGWGFEVRQGSTLRSMSENYFSGSDEERLADLQQMLDDPGVRAIVFARGGYGISRIIDSIDFSKFDESPKWLVGFSDITLLLLHITTRSKVATIHGPMANAFNDDSGLMYVNNLRKLLEGKKLRYQVAAHRYNRKGVAVGEVVGGNLSLIVHSLGSKSEIKTKERILFIEDVGEYLYNIDRMMIQLKRSGKLDKLAGLIVGSFNDMKDTERPFGRTVEEIILEHVGGRKYPVCFGFPIGHQRENLAVKMGCGYKLSVSKARVTLEE